jgi:uncharacterized protein YkwD
MSQATGDPNKTSVATPSSSNTPTPAPLAETKEDAGKPPFDPDPAPTQTVETESQPSESAEGASRAQDILAQIRARKG